MECLDESAILALVQGALPAADAKQHRHHMASCDACRALVGQAARALRTDDGVAATEAAIGNSTTALASDDEQYDSERGHLDDRAFMARVAPGTLLDDKYRIERILGSGGMGVVALATHVALGQSVAIKLLHPRALASAEAVARFVREARTSVKVASEHVVRVADVASLDSGEPYIVMEHLVGRDARAHLAERKELPVIEVIDLVAQACLGVGRAHRAGIVHRDLKPANLFVLDAPDRDVPFLIKVLDFGVSKIRRDEIGEHEASLTRSTAFLGTPLYMSPEQIRASRDVDARADVWALGNILYELLVGRAPFRRESLGLTCAAILVEEPKVLSRARGDVPRAVEQIVARCLHKDRDARFADGFDLAIALAPHAGESTREEIARVVGIDARPTAPRARSRLPLLLTLAAVPLVAGLVYLARRAPESTTMPPSGSPTPPRIEQTATPAASTAAAPPVASSSPAAPSPPVPSVALPKIKPIAPAPSPSPSILAVASVVPSIAPVPPAASSTAMNPEFGPRK